MIYKSLLQTSIFSICFIALVACKEDRPEGILDKGTMTNIIIDVYIGEGKVSALNVKRDSSLVVFEAYEKLIYSKYAVEKETYKNSLSYYYSNPEQLDEIYEAVMDSLNVREQKLKEDKEAADKKNETPAEKKDNDDQSESN
ncbi:MAG: DUF4296 domain-containing protein [Fulvivirga sp.]